MWNKKTEKLYLEDSYLKEFTSKVLEYRENEILLEKTAFYPEGGGQPSDKGKVFTKLEYNVINVYKDNDAVIHVLDKPFDGSEEVKGIIDWDLRYLHMRHHTAIHILSGIFYNKYKARITGSQIYPDRARMDINYELRRDEIPEIENLANEIVKNDYEIKVYYIDKKDFTDDLVRVREDLLPDIDKIRIVEISNFDRQADGGTHVKRTSEVGKIRISKYENKGKNNKRIYITLEKN